MVAILVLGEGTVQRYDAQTQHVDMVALLGQVFQCSAPCMFSPGRWMRCDLFLSISCLATILFQANSIKSSVSFSFVDSNNNCFLYKFVCLFHMFKTLKQD